MVHSSGTQLGGGNRTFTRLVDEAARVWCRSGLWYAGVDLDGISILVG